MGKEAVKRPSWDEYFLQMAALAAKRSSCMRRQVGAVIVKDKHVLSTGYNDTPRSVKNCGDGGCERCQSDQPAAYAGDCLCLHAEQNAIIQAAYHGTALQGGVMYITLEPCLGCSKMTANAGIVEVVYSNLYPSHDDSARLRVKNLFESAGIKLRHFPLSAG